MFLQVGGDFVPMLLDPSQHEYYKEALESSSGALLGDICPGPSVHYAPSQTCTECIWLAMRTSVTHLHVICTSARGGYREATGIRRAPKLGAERRFEPDLAWSRLGPNWTAGAEGTAGPIIGNRRFP